MSSRLMILIIYIISTMKADYVTKDEFKKFVARTDGKFKAIDKRFDTIDKRFDEMHVFIRDCMEEQRIHHTEECTRYVGSLYEKFSAQVSAIFEHPVFTTYKA